MEEGKIYNTFKNMAEGFQEFLHELAEPADYAKAETCLDMAKKGIITDPSTGSVIERIDPMTKIGIDFIEKCEINLQTAKENIPLSPDGGPP